MLQQLSNGSMKLLNQMDDLVKKIEPIVRQIRELVAVQAGLLAPETQRLLNEEVPDVEAINRQMDALFEIMYFGEGEADFWKLHQLLEKISPENAAYHTAFYKSMQEDSTID